MTKIPGQDTMATLAKALEGSEISGKQLGETVKALTKEARAEAQAILDRAARRVLDEKGEQ